MLMLFSIRAGNYSDFLMTLGLILAIGLYGAILGAMIGSVVGLFNKYARKGTFWPGLKNGFVIGYVAVLALWYLGCWVILDSICLAQ
jgi:hypothetical protein